MRDMKNFDKEEFLITLKYILSNIFANHALSVNVLFDKFVATFADATFHPSPFRKAIRKKKLERKPWITNNLLHCIPTKNKMYNDLRIRSLYQIRSGS